MIERYVDYIQVSILKPEDDCQELFPVSGLRFYKRGYVDKLGVRYYYGNPNPKAKKALVVASGEALENMRLSGLYDYEIIGEWLELDGKVSRIDLAVTEYIESELVTLWDVKKWLYWDLIQSTLSAGGAKCISTPQKSGTDTIETIYIGDMRGRGKRGIFRAYDKGIELGIMADIITRIELERRGDRAHNIAQNIARTNDVAGNFRSDFNVYAANFERIMEADAVKKTRGKAKEHEEEEAVYDKRWEWLMKQVAPSLKDAIEHDEKSGRSGARAWHFFVASGYKYKTKYNTLDFD